MAKTNDQSTEDDADLNADIEMVMETVIFPASRNDLLDTARDADVATDLILILEDLPEVEYETRDEAERAVKDTRRTRQNASTRSQ